MRWAFAIGIVGALWLSASCRKPEDSGREVGLKEEVRRLNIHEDRWSSDAMEMAEELERTADRVAAAVYPVEDLVEAFVDPASSADVYYVVGIALQNQGYDFAQLNWMELMRQHPPMTVKGRLRYRNHFLTAGEKPVAVFLEAYLSSNSPVNDRKAALRLALRRYPGLQDRLEKGSAAKAVRELLR